MLARQEQGRSPPTPDPDPDPLPFPHCLPHPCFPAVWRGPQDPCRSVSDKGAAWKRLSAAWLRCPQAGQLSPARGAARTEPLCSPPPSQTSQAAAGAPGKAAHMDPIRAEIISLGSLSPPCTGEQRGGTVGPQGCPWSPSPRRVRRLGRGEQRRLGSPCQPRAKESPFPAVNRIRETCKSPRHNKQGIPGCFKCVPAWVPGC